MNKKTNWKNAHKDALPFHNQDVLISVDGVNYVAIYDAIEKGFKLKNELGVFFTINSTPIYWLELTSPES